MNLNNSGWATLAQRFIARLRSDGPNSTRPVTEITGSTGAYTNSDIALVATGAGATVAQVPDGTIVGGDKRGEAATDWQKSRTASTQVASLRWSTIGGGRNNTAAAETGTIGGGVGNTVSAQHAVVAGGSTNTASGQISAIAGGGFNTASSTYAFVGGGESNSSSTNTHTAVLGGSSNSASGPYAVVSGGFGNVASATGSCVTGGDSSTSSGTYSIVAGGNFNTANAAYSSVIGGRRGITRGIIGYCVIPAHNSPIASANGVTQAAMLQLGRETTGNTATVLTSNTSAASTTNQVVLPNNSAYSFTGEIIAGVTGAGNTARWTINGAIKRGANAASTVMVGTPTVTMTHNDAGAAAWTVAVTADTTNGGIAVTVTGAAATTIRWVAKIETTEMTF